MNKYLIITGGSRGIGKATIKRFQAANWRAINLSRTPCDIAGVTNITVDLNDIEHLETTKLEGLCGDAHAICLVHNAAQIHKDSVETITNATLKKTLNINLIAPIHLNKLSIPFMKPGSSIIYIGSGIAETGAAGWASYTVSKQALIGLMRATCQDLANKSISTVCICPGFVDTQMLQETIDKDSVNWMLNNKIMAKRLIAPEEIAEIIYTCATQPVINGEVINANSGMTV